MSYSLSNKLLVASLILSTINLVGCAETTQYKQQPVPQPKPTVELKECVTLPYSIANQIYSFQLTGKKYYKFCKNCGEKDARGPLLFGKVGFQQVASDVEYYFFKIDDVIYNVSSIYIERQTNSFENLGNITHCSSSTISPKIIKYHPK